MPVERAKAAVDQLRSNEPIPADNRSGDPVGSHGIITRHLCLTRDLGVGGNLFGGVMLSWIDEAASMYAMLVIGSEQVITRAFKEAEFHTPVKLGDLVEFLADGYVLGNTSITVRLRVVVYEIGTNQRIESNSVSVTFVHVSRSGKPLKIQIPN